MRRSIRWTLKIKHSGAGRPIPKFVAILTCRKYVHFVALTMYVKYIPQNKIVAFIARYLLVSACRFKRQISDKPQCAVLGIQTKPQYIVQYTKNSPVFGAEIKYRAVEIYSFSKYTLTPRAFRERTVSRHSVVLRANLDMDFTSILSISPRSQSRSMRLKSSRFSIEVPVMPSSA